MKSGHAFDVKAANGMCSAYQHLVGSSTYSKYGEGKVTHVCVAPADELNKWFFFNFFLETGDLETSLQFYKYDRYDVVVISRGFRADGSEELYCQDLVHWLHAKSHTASSIV